MTVGITFERPVARSSGARVALGLTVVAWAILLPSGAGAEEATAAAPSAAAVSAASSSPLTRQDFPEPVLGALRAALGAYEKVRGQLAADQVAPAETTQLGSALRTAKERNEGLPAEVASAIEDAAVSAERASRSVDLAAVRADFGEVSRHLLRLAAGDPRLIEGWHVFSCPMAPTFDRWIQPSDKLENPYMGSAMLHCGSLVESPFAPSPVPAAAAVAATGEPSPEPELKPGIPGLKMVDVRDHKFLWREIDQLQIWESRDQLSVAEFRSKMIEKTAQYLELDGDKADQFVAAAKTAVAGVQQAFRETRRADVDFAAAQARFPTDVEAAVAQVSRLLEDRPRHRLFEPGCKEWLLRLTFGPKAAKEAKEAKESQEASKTGNAVSG